MVKTTPVTGGCKDRRNYHYMIKKMRNNTQCHLVAAANPLNHKYLFECDAVVCVRNASDTVMGQAYVAFETHHKFVKTL